MVFEKLIEKECNKSAKKVEQLGIMEQLIQDAFNTQKELDSKGIYSFLTGGLSVGLHSDYTRFSDDYDLVVQKKGIDYLLSLGRGYNLSVFENECSVLAKELPINFSGKHMQAYIISSGEDFIDFIKTDQIYGMNVLSIENICAAKTRELVRKTRGREIAKDAFDLTMLGSYNPKFVNEFFGKMNCLKELDYVPGVLSLIGQAYPHIKRILNDGVFNDFPTECQWKQNAQSVKNSYNLSGNESLDYNLRFILSLATNSTRKALQKATNMEEFNIVKLLDNYLPKINEHKKAEIIEAFYLDSTFNEVNKRI